MLEWYSECMVVAPNCDTFLNVHGASCSDENDFKAQNGISMLSPESVRVLGKCTKGDQITDHMGTSSEEQKHTVSLTQSFA